MNIVKREVPDIRIHYREAMQRLLDVQYHNWKRFYKPLPSVATLAQPEAQEILLERAREMKGIIERDEIRFTEFFRFAQEFDLICLLLIICVWGGMEQFVPLTDEDITIVDEAIYNFLVAGADTEKTAFDVVLKMLRAIPKNNQLTLSLNSLLLSPDSVPGPEQIEE